MKVRFGVFADLHVDLIHDGVERMERFLNACRAEKVDFCVELGDFCPPGESNVADKEKILAMLKECPCPFYHVLGNHDMDENTKQSVLDYISADAPHGSFDCGEIHFVLLDACCYRVENECFPYERGNYKAAPDEAEVPVLSPEELLWLQEDLAKTEYPSVIFSHQSLIESRTGIRNPEDFRAAVRQAPAGVLLAVCGHEHVDRAEYKEGVWYYCLNSMSYYWAGGAFSHTTYGESIEAEHPELRYVFPYRDPLFAIVEITDGKIDIRGMRSEIVGQKPDELNFYKPGLQDQIIASVEDRTLLI